MRLKLQCIQTRVRCFFLALHLPPKTINSPEGNFGLEVCFAAVCCIAGRFFYALKNKLSFVFAISEKCFYLCGMKNLKRVRITIPSEKCLSLIKSTPSLSRLSRSVLKVGDNEETVNHAQFSDMERLFPLAGAELVEIY